VKLALVRQYYTPFGGAERFVDRALTALHERGIDVTIIARRWKGEGGPPVLACNPGYLGRTWRDAGFARGVQRIIADGRFDLVQSHERIPGCHIYRAGDGVHATWLALRDQVRGTGARLATALSPWHRYTLAAEAGVYRHPNLRAVICNSRMVRDDIARRFAVPADKLRVIYNGVDLDFFHPQLRTRHRDWVRADLGVAERVPVILFVGSGFERKGVPALLHAMTLMRRQDATLLVVGQDKNLGRLRGLAAQLQLARRVRFLGGRQDLRSYFGAADLFCLPTLYDPMPNAALEALACGLPVVTSTTCGAAELIKPGENGFVCDALDSAALAENLDRLSDSDRPDPATVRASVEHLSLAAMAERLSALYGELFAVGALAQ
jgi:UDP-glucose:(heptosyl)LPS alpha-1,3-glucosyltransferase